MHRNRGKQQNGKDQRSVEENWSYQGTFHVRMGTIKERNSKDLIQAEEIKRQQEYTELHTKKVLITHIYTMVWSLTQSQTSWCGVKWALGSRNKVSGSDGIPVELFKILKDDAVNAVLNMSANLENSTVATGLERVSFHSDLKEGQSQRRFKVYNFIHFMCQQGYVQNPSSQALAIQEPRYSRCTSWIQKGQRNQGSNC